VEDDPEWFKALFIRKGSLAQMVFADVNFEHIQLNKESIWFGSGKTGDTHHLIQV